MGGKNKQRTKNNTKPSSSGRSAEQLSSALGGVHVSGGGTALAPAAAGLFPTLATPVIHSDLPPEFALALKKLTKKDPITRVKALQELGAAARAAGAGAAGALPAWAPHYHALAIDPDRQVREAAQVCQGLIAAAVGRSLARHVRALAPAWLLAAHDQHAPAKQHATLALQKTFPGGKLRDMVVFCRSDIVQYLSGILTGALDDAIAKRAADADERAEETARVRCGALLALAQTVRALSTPHEHTHRDTPGDSGGDSQGDGEGDSEAGWLWQALCPLLQHHSYAALATHQNPRIRAAWCVCTAEVCGAVWGARGARETARQLAAALLAAPAPACVQAILTLATRCPTYYQLLHHHANDKLRDKYLDFLKNGGWGGGLTPRALLPHLPPALRHPHFYRDFFEAALLGFEQKCVAESKSVRAAWLGDTLECCADVLERGCPGEAAAAHQRCVHAALHTAAPALMPLLASHSARLIRAALQRDDHVTARALAQNVAAVASAQLDRAGAQCGAGEGALAAAVRAHVLLLRELRAAARGPPAPPRSVTFADEPPSPVPDEREPSPVQPEVLAAVTRLGDEVTGRVAARLLEVAAECTEVAGAVWDGVATLLHDAGAVRALAGAAGQAGALQLAAPVLRLAAECPAAAPAAVRFALALLPHIPSQDHDQLYAMLEADEALVAASLEVAEGAALSAVLGRAGAGALPPLTARALRGHHTALRTLVRCIQHAQQQQGGEAVVQGVLEHAGALVGAAGADWGACGPAGALLRAAAPAAPPRALAALLTPILTQLLRAPQTANEDEKESECDCDEVSRRDPLQGAGLLLRQVGAALRAAPDHTHHLLDTAATVVRTHLLGDEEVDLEKAVRCGAACAELAGEDAGALAALLPPPSGWGGAPDTAMLALVHDVVRGRWCCPAPPADGALAGWLAAPPDADWSGRRGLAAALARGAALRAALCARAAPPHQPLLQHAALLLHDRAAVAAAAQAYVYAQCYTELKRVQRELDESAALVVEAVERAGAAAQLGAALAGAAARGGAYWAAALAALPPHITHPAPDPDPSADGFFHALQAGVRWEWELEEVSETEYLVMYVGAARAWAVAHGGRHADAGAALLRAAAAPALPDDHLDPFVDTYYKDRTTLPSPDSDLAELEWAEATSAAHVAVLLGAAAARGGGAQPATDLAALASAALLQAAAGTARWHAAPAASLTVAALRACCGLRGGALRGGGERAREWGAVFQPEVRLLARALLLRVLHTALQERDVMTAPRALVCGALVRALGAGLVGPAPPGELAGRAAAVLARPSHPVYIALAAHTLRALDDALVAEDEEKLSSWGAAAQADAGSQGGPPQLAAHYLLPSLRAALDRVEQILQHVRLGEEVWGEGGGAEYCECAGALALGAALLSLGRRGGHDRAHHYALLLSAHPDMPAVRLLSAALRLLPPGALQPGAALAALFTCEPALAVWEPRGPPLRALACRCVYLAASGPAAAALRQWVGAADARGARLVRRVLAEQCGAALAREQLAQVAALARELHDAEVTVSPSTREARVVLDAEGRRCGVTVRLPADFPATPARVSGSRAHQVALYLAARGGGLAAALRLWAGAAARAGQAACCYICYCRLHPTSGQLPAVPCYQCNNSFHEECLRQWFSASNKANCPLCRATF